MRSVAMRDRYHMPINRGISMSYLKLIPVVGDLLDKLIPDSDMRAKAEHELSKLEQNGELQLLIKQIEVNAQEAKHSSIFVAGWRPFIGWTCGLAFAYHFIGQPVVLFVAALNGVIVTLPSFDMSSLLYVLGGMLGLGGFRSYEKLKKVGRNKL